MAGSDRRPLELLRIYLEGTVYDLAFLAFAAVPLALYILLCPRRLWGKRFHRLGLHLLVGLSLYLMLFTALAEWLFWDEFGVRFNFIAVDYLVYSDEVLHNIMESYPVYFLLSLIAVLALLIDLALQRPVSRALDAPSLSWRGSAVALAGIASLALVSAIVVGQDFPVAAAAMPTSASWRAMARTSSSPPFATTSWTTRSSTQPCRTTRSAAACAGKSPSQMRASLAATRRTFAGQSTTPVIHVV